MFNRVAPGVLIAFLAAAVPPGSANGNAAVPSRKAPTPVSVESPNSVQPVREWPIDLSVAGQTGISTEVLGLALKATACAAKEGAIDAPPTLTVIDYSRPSVEPRLWTFDMVTGELLFKELVAHGRNTGDNLAKHFSNQMDSRQTSIGLFVTDAPYVGSNGYSLRLDGLDVGFNDRARERAIVMHGAPYVDPDLAARQGRIGRSWGCPALRTAIASKVIDRIRGGGVIFSYYPDQDWLESSKFLQECAS